MFQQFAVTVSIAMLISATNALTLSPALCALLVRPAHARRGILGRILNGIDHTRDGYSRVVTRLLRKAWIGIVVIVGFAVAAGTIAFITPGGFLPNEDQGAFFAQITLPPGASVNRTEATADALTDQVRKLPQVQAVISIIGFSLLTDPRKPTRRFW